MDEPRAARLLSAPEGGPAHSYAQNNTCAKTAICPTSPSEHSVLCSCGSAGLWARCMRSWLTSACLSQCKPGATACCLPGLRRFATCCGTWPTHACTRSVATSWLMRSHQRPATAVWPHGKMRRMHRMRSGHDGHMTNVTCPMTKHDQSLAKHDKHDQIITCSQNP